MALEDFIWFEKYRPQTLDDMSLSRPYKEAFQNYIDKSNVPHLLLSGIQGSGKTTIAYILMQNIPCVRLTLNASSKDRGINTITGLVKNFAGSAPPAGKIKIILLDEADNITADAQKALRNTMETYSKTCRFILTCNYPDRIIPAIHSRCTPFTFERFPKRSVLQLSEAILKKEGIEEYSRDDIIEIINRFYPDVRSVINNLQSACSSGALNLKMLGALKVDPTVVGDLIKEGKVQSIRKHLAGTVSFDFMYKWLWNEFLPQYKSDQQAALAQELRYALSLESTIPDKEINFICCCIGIMTVLEIDYDFNA